MKKILSLIALIAIVSCSTPGAYNPDPKKKTFIKIGSKILQAHKVYLTENNDFIYVLVPKDTSVDVIIEPIGYTYGDGEDTRQATVIKVE